MTKILYFLNSKVRGGVEEHVLSILEKLDREQFEPVLAAPQELIDLMRHELDSYRVRSIAVSLTSWFALAEIKKFKKILIEEKPQIVHCHLFKAAMFAGPLTKQIDEKIKVIDTAHIREAWRKGIKKAFFIDRIVYRYVERIIAVSNAVKRYLVEEKGLPQEKISVVRNGVHLEKFKAGSPSKPDGKITFGVIGRLEPQKGHRYFLEAIHKLGVKRKEAEYLIIGEGSLKDDLKKMAKDLGVQERVTFSGYRSDIVEAYNEIDVLVLPSLFEGLPLVALEACAMGKAVIVTDVDGSPEAVINRETGLVVPAQDPGALKEAMESLIDNRELVGKFGKRAREYVEKNFDVKKQVKETEEVYLQVMKNE